LLGIANYGILGEIISDNLLQSVPFFRGMEWNTMKHADYQLIDILLKCKLLIINCYDI